MGCVYTGFALPPVDRKEQRTGYSCEHPKQAEPLAPALPNRSLPANHQGFRPILHLSHPHPTGRALSQSSLVARAPGRVEMQAQQQRLLLAGEVGDRLVGRAPRQSRRVRLGDFACNDAHVSTLDQKLIVAGHAPAFILDSNERASSALSDFTGMKDENIGVWVGNR